MTSVKDTDTATLFEPTTADTATAPKEPEPRRGTALLWLLAGLIVAALAVLGAWTFAQSRAVDPVLDAPRVFSEHDSVIEELVRGRNRARHAAASEHDAWILRNRGARDAQAQAGDAQHDAGITLRVRSHAADSSDCAPPAPGAGGWEAPLAVRC